ncbi:MAG: DUF3429 domain-containing protein [Gammaproteobacteria bacterium]
MNLPVLDLPETLQPALPHNGNARRNAAWLGYAGLLPFVALAALVWVTDGDLQTQARAALIAYGAVIISFLGAWHWYAAIVHGGASATLAKMSFAVSPALLGWLAMLLPHRYGIALVITGLLLTCIADGRWQAGTHIWYRQLRQRLTLIATASMTAAVFSQL